MFPTLLSQEILDRIDRWSGLKQWERRELGQELRLMGLSYREIAGVIPVHKGTLSGWCHDLPLTDEQRHRFAHRPRTAAQHRVGAQRRRDALRRAAALRTRAREEARNLLDDPFWVAGVVAYWSEGAKRHKDVSLSNSDPALVALFIAWAKRYFGIKHNRFTAKLNLHAGQDEAERKQFWSVMTHIPLDRFRKTFIKPEGTGHRKNDLYNGTVMVRVTCSGDLLHTLRGWMDAVAESYGVLS